MLQCALARRSRDATRSFGRLGLLGQPIEVRRIPLDVGMAMISGTW